VRIRTREVITWFETPTSGAVRGTESGESCVGDVRDGEVVEAWKEGYDGSAKSMTAGYG